MVNKNIACVHVVYCTCTYEVGGVVVAGQVPFQVEQVPLPSLFHSQ